MQILLTGTGTLIGNNLAEYLNKKNYKLICSYKNNFPKNISRKKNIKLVKIDLEKNIEIKTNFNILIHCASAIPSYNISKRKMFKINVDGFKKLLEICKRNNCKKIILLSTTAVYGEAKIKNTKEDFKNYKISDYGKSKLIMESMLQKYCKANKCTGTILRLSGVIGKNSKHNFLSKTLDAIINKKKLTIFNPNFKFNNAIYVGNLCKIIFQLLKKRKFGVYNIASKYPLKLKNIIKLMIKIIHKKKTKISVLFKKSKQKSLQIDIKKSLTEKLEIYNTKKTILCFINSNKNYIK